MRRRATYLDFKVLVATEVMELTDLLELRPKPSSVSQAAVLLASGGDE